MNSKVVVIGKNGQVASALFDIAPQFEYIDRKSLDLSRPELIRSFFKNQFGDKKPDLILNLAAYTQVDKAESEKELAYKVNALASAELAQLAERYVYISTDYVFGGVEPKSTAARPLLETDPTSPVNYYGETKLAGEKLALSTNANSIIIRTSWVYSTTGVNFVKRIAQLAKERPELKVVADQLGSPTYAPDLANVILKIAESTPARPLTPGIYNYSNEGQCSWYEFAKEIVAAAQLANKVTPTKASLAKVLPILTKEYPTPARRPYYSVLDKTKIKQALNIEIPHWQDSFKKCTGVLFK